MALALACLLAPGSPCRPSAPRGWAGLRREALEPVACVGPKDRTSASLFQLLASQGGLRAWAALALTALLPLLSGHVAWAHPFSRCHTGRAGQAGRSPRAGQRDSSVTVSEVFDTWWVAGLETALRRPRVPEVGRPLLSGIAFFRYRLLTPKNGVCLAPLTPPLWFPGPRWQVPRDQVPGLGGGEEASSCKPCPPLPWQTWGHFPLPVEPPRWDCHRDRCSGQGAPLLRVLQPAIHRHPGACRLPACVPDGMVHVHGLPRPQFQGPRASERHEAANGPTRRCRPNWLLRISRAGR